MTRRPSPFSQSPLPCSPPPLINTVLILLGFRGGSAPEVSDEVFPFLAGCAEFPATDNLSLEVVLEDAHGQAVHTWVPTTGPLCIDGHQDRYLGLDAHYPVGCGWGGPVLGSLCAPPRNLHHQLPLVEEDYKGS